MAVFHTTRMAGGGGSDEAAEINILGRQQVARIPAHRRRLQQLVQPMLQGSEADGRRRSSRPMFASKQIASLQGRSRFAVSVNAAESHSNNNGEVMFSSVASCSVVIADRKEAEEEDNEGGHRLGDGDTAKNSKESARPDSKFGKPGMLSTPLKSHWVGTAVVPTENPTPRGMYHTE
ncbi:hypothetical protein CcaCcLH18_12851 [Colletotrichum camelliae]|nr:hypothetical protein CcaCcLH18_12851 [Colletotrichum camelliae]